MKRAEKLTNNSKFTIVYIPTEIVVARSAKIGVSLGDSPTQVLPSVLKTEEIDLNQTLVMLMNNRKN
jgi:hypothetical protein